MTYQDIWVHGEAVSRGDRECIHRWEIVRDFCAQYSRPFTVLDLGCAEAYFAVRLTEYFPDCTVAAIEHDERESALGVLRRNDARRVLLMTKLVSVDDLKALAEVEHFDVVLALSVIHRFPGTFQERVELLRGLGDHLILEIPNEPNTGGNVDPEYVLPEDKRLLGYGRSHLVEGGRREIVLLSRPKVQITRSYLGTPRQDLSLCIYSDFITKRVHFYSKPEERDWHRGINLQTWLTLGGAWPEKARIAELIRAARPEAHHDIAPWNVVLQGDAVKFVDACDPNMDVKYDDEESFGKLVRQFSGEVVEWPR